MFTKGPSPNINNVELGKHGRDRTNVWSYPGANRPGSALAKAQKDHPTPKPVELVADAILDVTLKGDLVLDPFVGSGTTIIAAHHMGRLGAGIELEPGYVDLTIRRFEQVTGIKARLADNGASFDEVAAEREAIQSTN